MRVNDDSYRNFNDINDVWSLIFYDKFFCDKEEKSDRKDKFAIWQLCIFNPILS